ncbi:MAG: peptidylprolyl isomerase [Geminicoccaceae bacterium]
MNLRLSSRLVTFIAALMLPLMLIPAAYAQTGQRIAAVVNNDIISIQDLTSRVKLAILFSGLPDTADVRRRIAPQVLRRMVDDRIEMQEAARLNAVAGEGEVSAAIDRLAQSNGLTAVQLTDNLSGQGIEPEALRNQVKAELSWVKIIRQRIASRAVVSDRQVDLALDAEKADGEPELLLSEIVLPVYEPSALDQAMVDATDLRKAIREGADFTSLARTVSVGETADKGGDLGWVRLSSLPGGLRPAVARLQPGQLSEPVVSPTGVHLFLMRDRRAGTSQSGDPQSRKIAQIFFPLDDNVGEDAIEVARNQAQALRSRLNTCDDVIRIAEQMGTPGSGDLGWMNPRDLPPDLAGIIEGLPVEQISQPVRSGAGLHLLMVCAVGGDRKDDATRRGQMRSKLENAQVQRLANRYLRDLRKDAFIDIRVGF